MNLIIPMQASLFQFLLRRVQINLKSQLFNFLFRRRAILGSLVSVLLFSSLSHGETGAAENSCRKKLGAPTTEIQGHFSSLVELQALDAVNRPTLSVNMKSREIEWVTPMAYDILRRDFGLQESKSRSLPQDLKNWLSWQIVLLGKGLIPERLQMSFEDRFVTADLKRHPNKISWLIVIRRHSEKEIQSLFRETFRLSAREAQVLYWLRLGKTNVEIANILGIASRTAEVHIENVYIKMDVESRAVAMIKASSLID